MAAIASFPSTFSIGRSNSLQLLILPSSSFSSPSFLCLRRNIVSFRSPFLSRGRRTPETRRIRSVAEETLIPEEEQNGEAQVDQPVSVPVSPSDMLLMFFQAEGIMDESAIPKVTTALEETDGISDLKVRVIEGIASVELTKQTTVQATGVASNLVETIQGSGFKLQTLNLSFQDEEDTIV